MNAVSPWYLSVLETFKTENYQQLHQQEFSGYRLRLLLASHALWLEVEYPEGGRVAFRTAYAPEGNLRIISDEKTIDGTIWHLESTIGKHTLTLKTPVSWATGIRYIVAFTPSQDITIPWWPRDIVPLGKSALPEGKVHISQKGHRSGLLYLSLTRPAIGSLLYFQNLGSFTDYHEDTHTEAADIVGGIWPEIGLSLPPSADKPLKARKSYIVSDACLQFSNEIPDSNTAHAVQFLNLLSETYMCIPKPETHYRHWPDIAEQAKYNLNDSAGCWQQVKENHYLNAYVSDYHTPPEIMVQLAVLLPLMEYEDWNGIEIPMIKDIRKGLPEFFDKRHQSIGRWLPALEDELDQSEEHKKHRIMDSWYLHHPLLNLARLSMRGDKEAKDMFVKTFAYAQKVARHFKYEWPVFYNMDTLEVVKAETQPGKGGEKDVAGLYAHVAIMAYEITGERKYLTEAKRAADTLVGKGFELFYQANNTAFSAKGLVKLYKLTRDKKYLNLSYICIANLIRNTAIWDCNYGEGKHYGTFFCLFPLNDAPYTAVYEEQEVFSAFQDYLELTEGIDIPPAIRLLLAEYIRYMMDRAIYYYPPQLHPEVIVDDAKSGEIDKTLWIPLEDIQFGWQKSGTVGQEVYGAGLSFALVPRNYYPLPGKNRMLFIDYPTAGHRRGPNNTYTFNILGDGRLHCRMIIYTDKGNRFKHIRVMTGKPGERKKLVGPERVLDNGLVFTLHGNQQITIHL